MRGLYRSSVSAYFHCIGTARLRAIPAAYYCFSVVEDAAWPGVWRACGSSKVATIASLAARSRVAGAVLGGGESFGHHRIAKFVDQLVHSARAQRAVCSGVVATDDDRWSLR